MIGGPESIIAVECPDCLAQPGQSCVGRTPHTMRVIQAVALRLDGRITAIAGETMEQDGHGADRARRRALDELRAMASLVRRWAEESAREQQAIQSPGQARTEDPRDTVNVRPKPGDQITHIIGGTRFGGMVAHRLTGSAAWVRSLDVRIDRARVVNDVDVVECGGRPTGNQRFKQG